MTQTSPNFYEVDFLSTETKKSGDAITLRYREGDRNIVHVVDGGFQETGGKIVGHIQQFYDTDYVDHVVLTHNDGDHSGGLRTVLEELEVGELWMLRPWLYADELIDRFARFTSVENLAKRLREVFSNTAALEDLAIEKGVVIREPFVTAKIGAFTVLGPSRAFYLDKIVESEKTPEAAALSESDAVVPSLRSIADSVVRFIRAAWGAEAFSLEETSAENEMSVVQYATLCGQTVVLTGDVGRSGLNEAALAASFLGPQLPGVDVFDVPHHGSRRNVSTEVLDMWLGERLPEMPNGSEPELFRAIVCCSEEDEAHPRKAVTRALIHRGGRAITADKNTICTGFNKPDRDGWGPATPLPYPEEQEGD